MCKAEANRVELVDLTEWCQAAWAPPVPTKKDADGGPIVCAMKVPVPSGKQRVVVRAHCSDTGCDTIFVFDDSKLAAYCCFDAKSSFVTDDQAFATWAEAKLSGQVFYKATYRKQIDGGGAQPMVDCPPPLRQFKDLLSPVEITLAA